MNSILEIDFKELPGIGDPLGGGYHTGLYRCQHTGDIRALVTGSKAIELVGTYGQRGQNIEGARSYTDGRANTIAMAEAGGETAQKVLLIEHNGCNDWAWPTRDQVDMQYRAFKPTADGNCCSFRDGDNPSSIPAGYPYTPDFPAQTTVEVFRDGGPEAFGARVYWSSTQDGPYLAWHLHFGNGYTVNSDKFTEFAVRPVRSIKVINSPF